MSAADVLENPDLRRFARRLGEDELEVAQSYKTTVLLGDRLILKLPEHSGRPTEADWKERQVLQLLEARLAERWQATVPTFVDAEEIDGLGLVQAHTRLPGHRPGSIDDGLARALAAFLLALHDISPFAQLVEFEGDDGMPPAEYLSTAPTKFAAKLEGKVSDNDGRLIERTVGTIREMSQTMRDPQLVLIHKDLYADNLLVHSDGALMGVVDWAAAQSGPVEWEFAILRQRVKPAWERIAAAYGRPLDRQSMDVWGLVQALRFWKSFPDQPDFVAEQRTYIKEILGGT